MQCATDLICVTTCEPIIPRALDPSPTITRRICDEIAIARLRGPLTDRRKFLRDLFSWISDKYRW